MQWSKAHYIINSENHRHSLSVCSVTGLKGNLSLTLSLHMYVQSIAISVPHFIYSYIGVNLWLTEVNVWEHSLCLDPVQPRSHAGIWLHALLQFALWKLFVFVPALPFTTPVRHLPAPPFLFYFLSSLASDSVTMQRALLWCRFP